MKRQERKGLFRIPYLVISERYQGDDLFTAIRRIATMHGKVHVEAYVDGDTYSSGPVHLKLRITQMPVFNDKAKMPAY